MHWHINLSNYKLGPNDIDLRGTGKDYHEALDIVFEKTGYSREQFIVSKWARDANGVAPLSA